MALAEHVQNFRAAPGECCRCGDATLEPELNVAALSTLGMVGLREPAAASAGCGRKGVAWCDSAPDTLTRCACSHVAFVCTV